jgi:hypothetical protein
MLINLKSLLNLKSLIFISCLLFVDEYGPPNDNKISSRKFSAYKFYIIRTKVINIAHFIKIEKLKF